MDAIPVDFRRFCRQGFIALGLAAPLLLVLLLCERRVAGALAEPLPLVGWLLVALLATLWLRWHATVAPDLIARSRAIGWLAPAVACFLALILWLPGTRLLAPILFVAIVGAAAWRFGDRAAPRDASRSRRPSVWPRSEPAASPLEVADEPDVEEEATGLPLGPSVVQELVRRRALDSAETVQGSVRADFAAGQRIASAHVAICPPFIRAPRCQAAVASGPSAQVRVATALPYGVRLEVKLAEPAAEPTSVVIELAIESSDESARTTAG
jgi:hypothetical protein